MYRFWISLFVIFTASPVDAGAPLNFVFFLADDISQNDLGCYGHPTIRTPHIDQLAQAGLKFENAYLTISSCSPSRCSLITGRYPHNTGAPELHTTLPEGQILFPKLLKDAGYYTALSGKHHMGEYASTAFDLVSGGKGPGKEQDWVEVVRNRPQDRPFFCWFASTDAHRTWAINDDAPKYGPEEMTVPPYLIDDSETRKDLTGYAHEVSRFDHYIGQVVAELKRQRLLETTVIIVAADNGRPFPRCKTRLYDSGIKTPLVFYNPEYVAQGIASSLVSAIDISATILELAGVEKDHRIQGVSFVPILQNPAAVVREVAFAEHNWHVFKNHERMVRFGDWLYIRNNFPAQQNLCVEAQIGGAGSSLWAAHAAGRLTAAQENIFWNPCPEEELYHVSRDPFQLKNIASDPEYSLPLRHARSLLAEWTEQTGDTIPADPTPDRNPRPGEPKHKEKHRHLEMPGDSAGAATIDAAGPVKL